MAVAKMSSNKRNKKKIVKDSVTKPHDDFNINHTLEKNEIIEKVVTSIQKNLPESEATLIAEFAKQFYGSVSTEELQMRSVCDLYARIVSHWNLIAKRKPGECKIHIYNPHFEQHGWSSTHTIIEISHDDMPFLVDSSRMELNREGLNTHLMIHFGGMKLDRDSEGKVIKVLPFHTPLGNGVTAEAPISIEVDRQTDPKILQALCERLKHVLNDVRRSVEDWPKMRTKLRQALHEIEHTKLRLESDEIEETKDFLRWLDNDHFTFLGYREYIMIGEGEERALKLVENSGLGVLKDTSHSTQLRTLASLTPEARKQALSEHILIITKTNTKATVHRPAYTDYIGIKKFNDQGVLIGEHRFIGLYTSSAYTGNPKYIPFVRRKVTMIMKNSNLSPTGHAGKALLNILETLPRDDLFQATSLELTDLAMGILHLQERKRIRMFARMDFYHRFISCLVYVPKERFDTELGYAIQEVLRSEFNAIEISFTTWFSESELARIHYVVRIDPKIPLNFDLKTIEAKLVEVGRSWKDELRENLLEYFGEEKGNALFNKYQNAFPAGYREIFLAKNAVFDIEHMESLNDDNPITMSFYRPIDEAADILRFKLFRPDNTIPLSDSLPVFENMGLRVMGERPYKISLPNGKRIWINDFSMVYSREMAFDIENMKDIFQSAFFHIWNGDAENDGFNKLILGAGLSWREISIIRAYTKYLRQIEFTYSQSYIEECFVKYPAIALMLVQTFLIRFDPKNENAAEEVTKLESKIQTTMDQVNILDEDRILRRIHEVINSTVRTNYFQNTKEGKAKPYFSFKLSPQLISDMPLPLPKFEIFVYSPRFEGVHLRSSPVARGGLRWSDRREDFRTEILGLMKAQVVKNAVIVPSGAKGGFVPKCLPIDGTREQILEEGVACYKNFIRGLLDLTDNLIDGVVVPPQNTVRFDDDDTYLVVAADKGTATFSDIANSISVEYQFWLHDAFASGGSSGYDHKKIGITARGAWESVKRHFRDLGKDIQNQDFTVVGIGDLAGDVFGNGMLLSKHIKLVAAFNHQHIFIDPNPDPAISYEERKRMFQLPRSSWSDYNAELISKGGGVFSRNVKSITISPEVKALFDIKRDYLQPNELIRVILRAPVDLLWNGGIGTFVKNSKENNSEVGDRSNDNIRINANELTCKVVGEGGNLGFTQLGRIEYDLNGGHIYTDFIDNSAGVDCSDHEVNIKILLNNLVVSSDLTLKQRDTLLVKMTDDVASLVLDNNYHQTQAINLAYFHARDYIDLHGRYLQDLIRAGKIDRVIEYLPNEETLTERKAINKGLTRPEIAILCAYCKSLIKKEILESDLPEEDYLSNALNYAFPEIIREKYKTQLQSHRLKREIIATIISNTLVNEMGFTFVYQLQDETGAEISAIVKAYSIARNVFNTVTLREHIENLDGKIDSQTQLKLLSIITRLVRRATRWFLRNRRMQLYITTLHDAFAPGVKTIYSKMPNLLAESGKKKFQTTYEYYKNFGVPSEIAKYIAGEDVLNSALDIIEAAVLNHFDLEEVALTYFALSERLDLYWFCDQLKNQPVDNRWEGLAREACRDDLDWQQRSLTIAVLQSGKGLKSNDEKINIWIEKYKPFIDRWNSMLSNFRTNANLDFLMYSVAIRELTDLTNNSFEGK